MKDERGCRARRAPFDGRAVVGAREAHAEGRIADLERKRRPPGARRRARGRARARRPAPRALTRTADSMRRATFHAVVCERFRTAAWVDASPTTRATCCSTLAAKPQTSTRFRPAPDSARPRGSARDRRGTRQTTRSPGRPHQHAPVRGRLRKHPSVALDDPPSVPSDPTISSADRSRRRSSRPCRRRARRAVRPHELDADDKSDRAVTRAGAARTRWRRSPPIVRARRRRRRAASR